MTMAQTQTSLTQNVTPITLDGEAVCAGFFGRTPVFALANGEALLAEIGAERRIRLHEKAAILTAQCLQGRMVSGGDDGRVIELRADGAVKELADEKGKWIDALALREDGATAWTVAKTVRARDGKGDVKTFTAPSGVRGLCFMPKGYRLALAHYNGVSMWFPNTAAEPEGLAWRGSHLDVTISPDGKFAVTAMQENALHGWRVADHKDMRMTGYPSKTRSFSWSHDGKWLATSGAEACIVWPFDSKDGPMGKGPRECGVRAARVTRVAFHPRALVLAAGYDDGWVMLCRLSDGSELLVRQPGEAKGGAISALAWNEDGRKLAFGAEDGAAGVLDLPA
jgi:WD40 repeat protein